MPSSTATREADVAFQRARVAFGLFADLHRDADERRAFLRNVGGQQEAIAGSEEIDRSAAGVDHFVDAIDDDAREHGRRGFVLNRLAEIVKERKHALLLAFQVAETAADRTGPPPLVAQQQQQQQRERGAKAESNGHEFRHSGGREYCKHRPAHVDHGVPG
jgi:hypothetical protein